LVKIVEENNLMTTTMTTTENYVLKGFTAE